VALTRAEEKLYLYMTEYKRAGKIITSIYHVLNVGIQELKERAIPVEELMEVRVV
jgi:hypothetical protein